MTGIAETLEHGRRRGGTKPLIPQHLAAMPDDLRELAERLLRSPRHSNRQVAEAFTDEGYPCSEGAITRHRQVNHLAMYARVGES